MDKTNQPDARPITQKTLKLSWKLPITIFVLLTLLLLLLLIIYFTTTTTTSTTHPTYTADILFNLSTERVNINLYTDFKQPLDALKTHQGIYISVDNHYATISNARIHTCQGETIVPKHYTLSIRFCMHLEDYFLIYIWQRVDKIPPGAPIRFNMHFVNNGKEDVRSFTATEIKSGAQAKHTFSVEKLADTELVYNVSKTPLTLSARCQKECTAGDASDTSLLGYVFTGPGLMSLKIYNALPHTHSADCPDSIEGINAFYSCTFISKLAAILLLNTAGTNLVAIYYVYENYHVQIKYSNVAKLDENSLNAVINYVINLPCKDEMGVEKLVEFVLGSMAGKIVDKSRIRQELGFFNY